MKATVRRWAVIVLLAVVPATLFAQACGLSCDLGRMSERSIIHTHELMPDPNQDITADNDTNDACPMAALCDFSHLSALASVHFCDTVTAAPTTGVSPSFASFTSTAFPPAQRPPAA